MSISYVTVTGPTEKVAEFMAAVGDGSGFLSSLLPPPADLEDHPDSTRDEVLAARFRQLHGSVDSYEWIREHWGLRRDADLEHMFNQDFGASAGLTGTLQTADAAPLTAFDTIAANYPQLRFDLLFEEEYTGGGRGLLGGRSGGSLQGGAIGVLVRVVWVPGLRGGPVPAR